MIRWIKNKIFKKKRIKEIQNKVKEYKKLPWTFCFKQFYENDKQYFVVWVKELNGCISQGDTIEEAFKNILEALELYLETSLDVDFEINLPKKDDF